MIEISNLSKCYGEKTVFNNVTFSVPDGSAVVLTGASGIGKTTLMRCIAGLEKPDSGTVSGLDGKRLTYAFQENRLIPQISVMQNLLCFKNDAPRAEALLKRTGLFADAATKAGSLSGGMKRRLSVVRALLYGGDVYFLDEPFKELDPNTAFALRGLVKEETVGKTLFLITHDSSDVNFFNATEIKLTRAAEQDAKSCKTAARQRN